MQDVDKTYDDGWREAIEVVAWFFDEMAAGDTATEARDELIAIMLNKMMKTFH